jgi:hypothetical protein
MNVKNINGWHVSNTGTTDALKDGRYGVENG